MMYPNCPFCQNLVNVAIADVEGLNHCPSCKKILDAQWWIDEINRLNPNPDDLLYLNEPIVCPICNTEVRIEGTSRYYIDSPNHFNCPKCHKLLLDTTCKKCFGWHHEDSQGFYECDGLNPFGLEFLMITRSVIEDEPVYSSFIDRFGMMCMRETNWDFPMTSSERFGARQLGVLVLFDSNNRKQPIGYVTYAKCPLNIRIPEGKMSVSPYVISDLFVIRTKRREGNGKLLLSELAKRVPELIIEGAFNYSFPATDSGWSTLQKAYPNSQALGRKF